MIYSQAEQVNPSTLTALTYFYINLELAELLRKYFTKFRCRNHRLPIEGGVRSQVLRDMRIC